MKKEIMNLHETHQAQYEEAVTEANSRIDELLQIVDDKKKIIKAKKTISSFMKSKIRYLEKKLAKKSRDTVEVDEGNSDRESSHVSAEPATVKTKKMIILSDSDKFTDEKEPRIDSWALKIKSKLRANASLFPNEEVRIGYVQNLIDGQTLRRLEPRFRENSKNSYPSADAIVENLRRMYGDSNRRLTAVNFLRGLRMKGNNFIEFWAEFQRLTAELEYSDEHLREEFIHKLSPLYQKHLSVEFDKTPDLYDLASTVRKTADRWKAADNIENRISEYKTTIASDVTTGYVTSGSTSQKVSSREMTPSTPVVPVNTYNRALTPFVQRRPPNPDPTKEKIMAEGRCFNCGETGHIVKNCTKPKAVKLNEIVEEVENDSGKE